MPSIFKHSPQHSSLARGMKSEIHLWHDDVIKCKHFPRYWPFVRGIHRSPVNSLHKGQWRGALMFSLICAWINGWVNNREAGDLRRHCAHYDVTVIIHMLPMSLWHLMHYPIMLDCVMTTLACIRTLTCDEAYDDTRHHCNGWYYLTHPDKGYGI